MKKNKGITLIALIITIIVMLILVAVSVNVLIKSNLIGTAEKAVDKYKTASEEEANGGAITIDGEKYDSIEDYVNRNNLNLMYKEANGKIRVYLKNSLYDYVDKLSLEDKNSFCLKYGNIKFEDAMNNYITNECGGDEQKYISKLHGINREDADNIFYIMCLGDISLDKGDNEEFLNELSEIVKNIYTKTVNLTFENTTEELDLQGNTYIIKKNGTYKFTAVSEEGKTGELEVKTNFEEGKFKINIEDVGTREYTFIKGLTFGQLASGKVEERPGEIIMPDGVEFAISQDYLPFVYYNEVYYDINLDYKDLIEDGKTYTATKSTE